MARSAGTERVKVVSSNRRARRNYTVVETVEAGLALLGSEVKSLRDGRLDLKDSYGLIKGGEAYLIGAYIAPYEFAREGGHEPERERKLLLHRREIDRIGGQLAEKGLTLVPLQVYFKDGKAKVELGLAKGKTSYDKRETIKERDHEREMDRAVSQARRRST
ncbi:MAG TPA: SsrA-binding protein SmpB [Acidimicrobiia bacterium]|jgi:SsrA-binding protein|nr:SsrA-binding protein SmpB [Acidimicrobiia bacterium]